MLLKLKIQPRCRCTKQSCPPPLCLCRGSLASPTQAQRVDGHVASREHQSLHANQTVDAVEGRGRNSPKHHQLEEMRWWYPIYPIHFHLSKEQTSWNFCAPAPAHILVRSPDRRTSMSLMGAAQFQFDWPLRRSKRLRMSISLSKRWRWRMSGALFMVWTKIDKAEYLFSHYPKFELTKKQEWGALCWGQGNHSQFKFCWCDSHHRKSGTSTSSAYPAKMQCKK